MSRFPPFERELLHAATRDVGLMALGWERLVEDRLTEGQRLYGSQALSESLHQLKKEIREEALDIGAWAVLTAQSVDVQAMEAEKLLHVRIILQQIAGKGAEVENLLRQLAEVADGP